MVIWTDTLKLSLKYCWGSTTNAGCELKSPIHLPKSTQCKAEYKVPRLWILSPATLTRTMLDQMVFLKQSCSPERC